MTYFILAFCCLLDSFAYPQSISKRAAHDQGDPPALALMAASGQYIYRLENLLVLQENDVKTNEEYLERNQSLISKIDLEAIKKLIESSKELINFTRTLLAEAELRRLTEEDDRGINRHKESYSETTLLRVIKLNALPETEIRAAIERRGVDFEMNEVDEMLLSDAGASKALLRLIRSSYRQ